MKLRSIIWRIALSFAVILTSCGIQNTLNKTIKNSKYLSENFTGFYLYDVENEVVVFDRWGNKYFTPASNTKILTLFSALTLLGDSVPAFYYKREQDSLIIWGSGSPLLLHHNFPPDSSFKFLKDHQGKLFFSLSNFHDTRYGPGWSWDDMPYYYSPERSSLPVFGNTMQIKALNDSLFVSPEALRVLLRRQPSTERDRWRFYRPWDSPFVDFVPGNPQDTVEREIPFYASREILKLILEDTLNKPVEFVDLPKDTAQTFYIQGADSLYRRMMQNSDNFLAEQILLMCSGVISDSISSELVIDYILENHLNDLPDPPVWVDGSGLSRYNLISPRDVALVLKKIYDVIGMEGIQNIFAAGGVSGTIRNYYKMDPPFIYAKTGTLGGVHALSGYLIAKSGKVMIFSFMNSNYRGSSTPFKHEMDSILRIIYEKY